MREPTGWGIDGGLQRQGRSSSPVLCVRTQYIEHTGIDWDIRIHVNVLRMFIFILK